MSITDGRMSSPIVRSDTRTENPTHHSRATQAGSHPCGSRCTRGAHRHGHPHIRGPALLRRPSAVRTVEDMDTIFDSLRSIGFRRGPRRIAAGIGGGLAEKLGLNVWLVRLLLLVSFLLPVLGFGAYLVVWVLTPWQNGRIPLEQVLGS